jgi:hypothetical protein
VPRTVTPTPGVARGQSAASVVLSTSDGDAPAPEPPASFARAAREHGYDGIGTGDMYRSLPRLGLSVDAATRWLEAGITPWGATTWIERGMTDPDEVAEYRRWRLPAEVAYWAHRDGYTPEVLRALRALFELLAGAPAA